MTGSNESSYLSMAAREIQRIVYGGIIGCTMVLYMSRSQIVYEAGWFCFVLWAREIAHLPIELSH